jgi:hypothetical protein
MDRGKAFAPVSKKLAFCIDSKDAVKGSGNFSMIDE